MFIFILSLLEVGVGMDQNSVASWLCLPLQSYNKNFEKAQKYCGERGRKGVWQHMSEKQVLKPLKANFFFESPGLHLYYSQLFLLAHVPSKKCLLSQQSIKTTWHFCCQPKILLANVSLQSTFTSTQLVGSRQWAMQGHLVIMAGNPRSWVRIPKSLWAFIPVLSDVSEWWYEVRLYLLRCKGRSRHLTLQAKFVVWCHSFSSLTGLIHGTFMSSHWSFVSGFFCLILWCFFSNI